MRCFVFLVLSCCALQAQQQQSSTYVYDLNGHRVDWTQDASSNGRASQTIQTANGRSVPLMQTVQKVLKDEGGVRIVERIVRHNEVNGHPLPPEKTVVETTTRPDGTATERVTVWRGDLNGNLQLAERSSSEIVKAGDTTVRQTALERATINGVFQPVERRTTRETATKISNQFDETVYTPDPNGRFIETARRVTNATIQNGETNEQTDEYLSTSTGSLQLAKQYITRTVKEPNGAEQREVNVFGTAAPGRAVPNSNQLQLREKQYYTTTPGPAGTSTQVFSIQRPSINSAAELGPVVKISETVVTPNSK